MAAEIATLCKMLFANFAPVGSFHVVLAEVIPQVAALSENRVAVFEATAEVQFDSFCFFVSYSDSLMPLVRYKIQSRYSFKFLGMIFVVVLLG